jgi:hypothetical protein
MANSIAQTHCCYWDLGRLEGVCGKGADGSIRDTLLGELLRDSSIYGPGGHGVLITQAHGRGWGCWQVKGAKRSLVGLAFER